MRLSGDCRVLEAGHAGPYVLTPVERKTGYVALGKPRIRRAPEVNAYAPERAPLQFKT
ncbi:MAG: hypothetical protein OEY20_00590 [Gemmatimonadota bacterium]|nr:hypothetical protein [Gemmatimonadota bacterium]